MTIEVSPKTFSFYHVCSNCGGVGPDESDRASLCGPTGVCLAQAQGWQIDQQDLCPTCKVLMNPPIELRYCDGRCDEMGCQGHSLLEMKEHPERFLSS